MKENNSSIKKKKTKTKNNKDKKDSKQQIKTNVKIIIV